MRILGTRYCRLSMSGRTNIIFLSCQHRRDTVAQSGMFVAISRALYANAICSPGDNRHVRERIQPSSWPATAFRACVQAPSNSMRLIRSLSKTSRRPTSQSIFDTWLPCASAPTFCSVPTRQDMPKKIWIVLKTRIGITTCHGAGALKAYLWRRSLL